MPTNHKKVNRTRKVVRKGKKMSGGSRKVNRTRKVAGRSRKMVGGLRSGAQKAAAAARAAESAQQRALAKAAAKKKRPVKVVKAVFAPLTLVARGIGHVGTKKSRAAEIKKIQRETEKSRKDEEDAALYRALERQGENMRTYGISSALVSDSARFWGI
jgi:hypothetical protein